MVALVVVVALVTSGCLGADVSVEVDADRSGEVRLQVTPPVELSGEIEDAGVEDLVEDAIEGIDGADFEVEDRFRDTYIVVIPFRDYRQLTDDIADGGDIAGGRVTPFARFDLRELPDGGWELDAATNPLGAAVSFPQGSPLGVLVQRADDSGEGSGVELSITLPGKLVSSNADSQIDGTAVWSIDDPTASYELHMRTEEDPLLDPLQWVLLGLLALLVTGAALMFVGATGPSRGKNLFKRSRGKSDPFLHEGTDIERSKSSGREPRHHARRNKKLVAGGRPDWVDPLAHQPVDPQAPHSGEAGPQPHRELPPLPESGPDGLSGL